MADRELDEEIARRKQISAESDDGPVIEFHPQALRSIKEMSDKDPAVAQDLRELFANMRQAMQAVKEGRYPSFQDAMEAITGSRPVPVFGDE